MKIVGDKSISGDFSAVTAGNALAATALFTGKEFQKVRGLMAKVTVLAETNTLTLTAKWQVSRDNSTWVDVANGPQNAAGVALATGTAGADTAVTRYIMCPDDITYSTPWVRLAIVVGAVNGTVNDTYAISYDYTMLSGAEIGL